MLEPRTKPLLPAEKSRPDRRPRALILNDSEDYFVTLKLLALVAVPPGVVTAIFPVTAPVGTVALTCVSEFAMGLVACTPPNMTIVVCASLTPVIVTDVPMGPLGGAKPVTFGVTRNGWLLASVPEGVVTVTEPVPAPTGTVAVISELLTTLKTAAVPSNITPVAPVKLFPRILTAAPTLPEAGCTVTNGPRAMDRLKTVPKPVLPPL